MDEASLTVAIIAVIVAAGSLVVSIVALIRSPKVLWIAETNIIEEDDGSGETPYRWRIVLVNVGRDAATAVETTFRSDDLKETPPSKHGRKAQGESLTLSASMSPAAMARLKDPLTPKSQVAPRYVLSWRSGRERRSPHHNIYFPNEMDTSIDPEAR